MKKEKTTTIKWLKLTIHIILFITLPALITACVEFIQIRNIASTTEWVIAHPYQVLLGYALVCLVFIVVYMIFNRLWAAMLITSGVFMTFALINYHKLILRGDPFMPWDLMLQKEAGNILGHLNISVDGTTWAILAGLILITAMIAPIKPFKIKWPHRLAGVTVWIIISMVFMQNTYLASENIEKMGIQDVFWNQTRNYEINGFLTGFGMNIRNAIIKAPSDYNKGSVEGIIDEYTKGLPVFASNTPQKEPNIIIIMNEALWDPTVLEGIEYDRNPIPTINKIRQEGASGWLLTPGYGGGTSNTEFEVLTGHSMSFFPTGSMAYQQYIKGPLDSMASYLKKKGYSTIAIHPYEKWFWNREEVYPYLGFDEFISEEDFVEPHRRGAFISDMEASHEIIRQYEKQKGKPFFNYTVTMQNHGPYNDQRYGDDTIKIKAEGLSDESTDILETFTEGVRDADDAFKYLIDYFERVDDPTIILMFGDHLPMLGNDYSVYREAGFISKGELSLEDEMNLHMTPLVIWNNYDNKKEDIGILNASYLGAYTMEYAKMEMPLYFNFLNQINKELPSYIKEVAIEKDGTKLERLPQEQEELRQKHWMLQYDMMFGKNYGNHVLYGY